LFASSTTYGYIADLVYLFVKIPPFQSTVHAPPREEMMSWKRDGKGEMGLIVLNDSVQIEFLPV